MIDPIDDVIQLFSREQFTNLLSERKREISKEIDKLQLNPEELLNLDTNNIAQQLNSKYSPSLPVLKRDQASFDSEPTQVNTRQVPRITSLDKSEPIPFDGIKAVYFLPFEGDKDFFNYASSNFDLFEVRPKIFAALYENEIQLIYQNTKDDKKEFDRLFIEDVQIINNQLELLKKETLKSRFLEDAIICLEAIKTDYIKKKKGLPENVGIPLRKKQKKQSVELESKVTLGLLNHNKPINKSEEIMHKLRILQISDLHVRGLEETEAASRYRILRSDKWKENLNEILSKVPRIDLVAFTGDIANKGKAETNVKTAISFKLVIAPSNKSNFIL